MPKPPFEYLLDFVDWVCERIDHRICATPLGQRIFQFLWEQTV